MLRITTQSPKKNSKKRKLSKKLNKLDKSKIKAAKKLAATQSTK